MALDEPNGWFSLLIGFMLTILGVVPLLNSAGIIGFNLPGFILSLPGSLISLFLIAGAGVYLLIDSFFEDGFFFGLSLITSFIMIVMGAIPILHNFGIIGFTIPYGIVIYNILFTIEGFLLIVAAFAMN